MENNIIYHFLPTNSFHVTPFKRKSKHIFVGKFCCWKFWNWFEKKKILRTEAVTRQDFCLTLILSHPTDKEEDDSCFVTLKFVFLTRFVLFNKPYSYASYLTHPQLHHLSSEIRFTPNTKWLSQLLFTFQHVTTTGFPPTGTIKVHFSHTTILHRTNNSASNVNLSATFIWDHRADPLPH